MAKVMDIGDVVKKSKVLLLDIEGTTTSIGFVKDKLFPYAEDNVKSFLEKYWETDETKEAVAALRKQATEDNEKCIEGYVEIAGEDASKEDQIESLVKNVKWQMAADRKVGPLKQLQGAIWKEGYDNGDIKGHVFDDVAQALELWRSMEGKKVYIYSSGSVQAQKLLFSKSMAGDMLPLIDGHFDTAVGAKQEPASYAAIVEKIGCKAEEILFLSDIVKEAEAARTSGLQAALLSREGNAPLPADIEDSILVLHSFDQLAVSNKRKPDPQVEEVPAKVPKTEVHNDVKSTSIMDTEAANGSSEMSEAVKTADVTDINETMEVDSHSEMKVDPAVEAASAEVSDDVPMTDSTLVANDNKNEAKEAVSTTDAVKTDNRDTSTVVSVEAPKVSDSKVVEIKSVDIAEKTKMVDAATVTDSSNKVDAATETILESDVEEPQLKEEAPEMKAVQVTEESAETIQLKSASEPKSAELSVAHIEQKEVEIPANETVDSKSDEEPGAVKTENVTNNGINPDDAKSVENSEKKTISNGSIAPEASIKEAISAVEADVATKAPIEIIAEDVPDQKKSAELPESNIEPLIKEAGETEMKETAVIETQVSSTVMEVETVSQPSVPIENSIAEVLTEETAPAIEIQDITDDKQSLEEDADLIADVVPIVEEPSSQLEAEALQSAGDVLEKECDEILSKVQDVTNINFIPVKALHTISEEMETESADSNDIVERILDTEMELSIKNQEVGQNMGQEMNEPKIEAENKIEVEKSATETPEKTVHMCVDTNEQPSEKNNGEGIKATLDPTVEKMEAEVAISECNADSEKTIEVGDISKAQKSNSDSQIIEPVTKSDENEQNPKADVVSQENTENGAGKAKIEDVIDTKVNGKANDAPNVKLNGNSTPDHDLKSRLAAENGKEKVNGSNGNSANVENGQGDNKTDSEIAEIKTTVKTVATEDMRAAKEQPVEG